jgi:hypothetical protein
MLCLTILPCKTVMVSKPHQYAVQMKLAHTKCQRHIKSQPNGLSALAELRCPRLAMKRIRVKNLCAGVGWSGYPAIAEKLRVYDTMPNLEVLMLDGSLGQADLVLTKHAGTPDERGDPNDDNENSGGSELKLGKLVCACLVQPSPDQLRSMSDFMTR